MTKRFRIALSVFFLMISMSAVAAAAASHSTQVAMGPVGLLTGALLCIALMLMVWSDDLDRVAIRRNRARRRA
jgi:hypothetical protein